MKKLFQIGAFFLVFASPALAQKGYLFVESVPDSAVVIIDGSHLQKYFTPVLCTLSIGEHSIEITKRFYESEMFKVKIESEAVVRKRVDFVRQEKFKVTKPTGMTVEGKYGQLTIITNPHGAEVLADGEKLSLTTPVTLSNVPAGLHRFAIVYHYIQYDTTIIVTGDDPQTAVIDLRHFEGKESYSIMPRVTTKVVIVVPGCDYRLNDSGALLIKGVDAEINIRTGDTSLMLTHKELADFPATPTNSIMNEKGADPSTLRLRSGQASAGQARTSAAHKPGVRLPKTEFTYIFEPYLDAKLQFDINTYTSKKKHQPKVELKPQSYYHNFPASLNSGKTINVRIYIEDDGEIVFRYW